MNDFNNRQFRKISNLTLLSHRIKSKWAVFKDKYLTWKQFFKILIPLLLIILIMPFAMVYIINFTYEGRIIKKSDDIPSELRTLVADYEYEDIISNPDKFKVVADEINELYLSKKINKIYIFAQSTSKIPAKEDVAKYFKEIPTDHLEIDIETKDPITACKQAKGIHRLSKFLVLSYKENLIRMQYICNSIELYVVGYQPEDIKWVKGDNMLTKTLKDIAQFNFNI